jgi:HNH endonuclease
MRQARVELELDWGLEEMNFKTARETMDRCCREIDSGNPASSHKKSSLQDEPREKTSDPWWELTPQKMNSRKIAYLVGYASICGDSIPIYGIRVDEGFMWPDLSIMTALYGHGYVTTKGDSFLVTQAGREEIAKYLDRLPNDIIDSLAWVLSHPPAESREDRAANARFEEDEKHEEEIQNRTDIGPTQKLKLVKARRGQGIFKKNLENFESACRVTGVGDIRHLRASHMKPWRDSTDFEKLDGNNGLLLSPHVDHLFDRGHISFSDAGTLLVSPDMTQEVLETWGIFEGQKCGVFREEQRIYLDYHRDIWGYQRNIKE